MDTSGFYKLEQNQLYYGPNFVYAPTFTLLRELKDSYEYPIDGWYWFDTVEQARQFWNLPEPEGETQ